MRLACLVALVLAASVLMSRPDTAFALGYTACMGGQNWAGQYATSGGYIIGSRATVEGQSLPLCVFTGTPYASGSFHWAAIDNTNPSWFNLGANIVQIGYGHCTRADNNLGLGTLCDSNYYWYWAWGQEGCGPLDGSGPGDGPVPIRIGSALGSTPPTTDFYVIRHSVNGVVYYDGYVNGSLLSGLDANGNQVSARIAASRVCWDSENDANRHLDWFGETWDGGDSMGGWTGSTRNHLDYNPLQYSINTGWLSTNLSYPGACNEVPSAPVYTCTKAASSHIYIDTNR